MHLDKSGLAATDHCPVSRHCHVVASPALNGHDSVATDPAEVRGQRKPRSVTDGQPDAAAVVSSSSASSATRDVVVVEGSLIDGLVDVDVVVDRVVVVVVVVATVVVNATVVVGAVMGTLRAVWRSVR